MDDVGAPMARPSDCVYDVSRNWKLEISAQWKGKSAYQSKIKVR